MIIIGVTMLVILAIAAVIALYVAFPHRGEDVPRAPWLGRVLRRGVESLPTLEIRDDPAIRDLNDLSELVRRH